MKYRRITLFSGLLLGTVCFAAQTDSPNLTQYVDQYIGTGGHGHTFVGPTVPFGAIQPGPNHFNQGWDWCSGYHYSSTVLRGFSHLHLSGTGCSDTGDILVMPTTGEIKINRGSLNNPDSGYASRYSHDRETVSPSFYSVILDDYDVHVDLTSTERVALHRYQFPSNQIGHVIIDLHDGNGDDQPTQTYLERIDEKTFGGYRFSSGWADDQRVNIALTVQNDIETVDLYAGGKKSKRTSEKGKDIKAVLSFSPTPEPVLLKVAISPVSIENALGNIVAEMPNWNFEEVVAQADKKWNDQLSKIQIKTDSDETQHIFYTAMYHSMIAPVLFNDHNRDYRGTDKKIYKNAPFDNYSVFSLWDTYRAQHPLMTITQPERVDDMVQTLLAIYEQQGKLPVWHLMGNETEEMIGYHAVPVIVDAYLKGFDGFDAKLAFDAMKVSALKNHEGGGYLKKKKGYIPADKEVESVAKGLEYAIDDACIALMAQSLGRKKDAAYFQKRAKAYAHYFDPETTFMRGRMSDGSWKTPFDPTHSLHRRDDYCEGNGWQYTWLVPHDVEGLIGLFGSEEVFLTKLDALFSMNSDLSKGASADISGLIGQYAHGNEPGHHSSYLYAFAGQQWKTAETVRKILRTQYAARPDGLCGNEDCGQLSAWYIFSAMGFYPVHPAIGKYVLGSPVVDRAVITLQNDKTFTLEAKNNSDQNIYIQSATYNGQPYTQGYITHQMITDGGTLTLNMGSVPNPSFASAPANRPTSKL